VKAEHDDRYSRQRQLNLIGIEGMAKIRQAHICIVGIGALGCQLAELCCRAGVGRLTLLDRDYVELSNLQRQCLFTEAHAAQALPKALAASQMLRNLNSEVELTVIVAELNAEFVRQQPQVFEDLTLLLDGSDNFACRFLLNEIAIARQIPYIYGAAVGTEGCVMPVIPGVTACLRCLMPSQPAAEATCATHGVLASSILQTAAAQFTLALKVITDHQQACPSQWQCFDVWHQRHYALAIPIHPDCPTCQQRQFPLLQGENATRSQWLCGRSAIQLYHASLNQQSLTLLAHRFAQQVRRHSGYHLELDWPLDPQSYRLTVFQDGRLIVSDCSNEEQAQLILKSVLGGLC
jgi:adenylyltransferase/sulfurtransferase